MEEKNKKGFLSKFNFNAKLKTKVIIVFICALLIAFILPLAWYVITEGIGSALKGIVSSFEDMSKLLFVTDEGSIEISDEDVDNFIKEMVKEDISVEQLGIPKSKQREYIKKFMMAYLVTQTPNAHVENEQNGAIWLQRHNAREDEIVDMIYVKELTTESGTDKYSINEDGNIIYIGVNGEICTIESSKYEKYRIPMMFFLELCITTQNPNYVRALAQEVIDNTKIVIVLEESEYITTTTIVNVQEIYDQAGNMIRQVSNETTETTVTKSVVPIVTEVDELLYSRTQTYNRKENVGDSSTRTEIIREENPREYQIITSQTTSYTFERGVEKDLEVKYKQDDPFPKLTKTEYVMPNNGAKISAYDSIKSGGEVMFENMDKHMEDEELIQVLKYVLYKMTGIDYGVNQLNGSLFSVNDFTKIGVGNALAELLKSYENDALRKYMNGTYTNYSSVSKYVTEDRKYYKLHYFDYDNTLDFSYGIMVYNYNSGKINNAGYFSEEGLDLASLISQYQSGQEVLVEVEKLDRIYLRIINDKKKVISDVIQQNGVTMESYQIDALVNVAYQYGNCGQYISGSNNIANLYKVYYEKGKTEEFKIAAACQTDSGYLAHFFVTGNYPNREKYNWILFNEGIYTLADGTVITASSNILDVAEECHKYMEGKYWYSLYSLPRTAEMAWQMNTTCCATFVDWVLAESGYKSTAASLTHSAPGLFTEYATKFQIIPSYSELQPGDIVFIHADSGDGWGHAYGKDYRIGHVQIYAGNDTWYNAGCDDAIRNPAPSYDNSWARTYFTVALRPN